MADFAKAIPITLKNEGGYVNDPVDTGGETYRGISRRNWPNWSGWRLIDQHKQQPGWRKRLDADMSLQSLIREFYWVNFWNAVRGDQITDQDTATALFDAAVNMGVGQAVKLMQRAVGVDDDGKIGPATLAAINAKPDAEQAFRTEWKGFYDRLIARRPDQARFRNGWYRRAEGH